MKTKLALVLVLAVMFLVAAQPSHATVRRPKKDPCCNTGSKTVVVQSSKTAAMVSVNQIANSGGNKQNGNVKGTNTMTTGDVSNTATVRVTGGSNTATVDPCGCGCTTPTPCGCNGEGPYTVSVGNGCGQPTCSSGASTETVVVQSAETFAAVSVTQVGNSGDNEQKYNVFGSNTMTTGKVTNEATVTVTGGSNTLNM